jgi:hypothetical protein
LIEVTYKVICDICTQVCDTQTFDCTNMLGGVMPQPTRKHTYQIGGIAELCDQCAVPIAQAKHDVIMAHLAEERGEQA